MSSCEERALEPRSGRSSLRPIPSSLRGSETACTNKAGRTGAQRRHKGFGERLEHVRSIVARLPVAGPAVAFSEPLVQPDLKIYCVPERSSGGTAPLGLSKEGNSQNQSRRGLSGMPHPAKRRVKGILTLMEDFRERLIFGTCSLPDEDLHAMAGTGQWPKFQRRYADLMIQHLKAYGDEAIFVMVAEIGDIRARRTGRPMPHIHFCCTGWGVRKPNGQWLLSHSDHDEIINKAAQYAGLPRTPRPAAGNMDQVKKSVVNYMSKYLTKQVGVGEVSTSDGYEDLIPHQWWNRSDEAHALIEGSFFRLPAGFCMFLIARQKQLEGESLGRGGHCQIGVRKTLCGDVPIEIFRFQFFSPEALHSALEYYSLWCIAERSLIDSRGGGMSS